MVDAVRDEDGVHGGAAQQRADVGARALARRGARLLGEASVGRGGAPHEKRGDAHQAVDGEEGGPAPRGDEEGGQKQAWGRG